MADFGVQKHSSNSAQRTCSARGAPPQRWSDRVLTPPRPAAPNHTFWTCGAAFSPAPGPRQLRHWAATPDAGSRARPHCEQSMEAPRTFVPFNDYGKALNRSASPQRYPRPTKPINAQPRRLSFGAAERAPTTSQRAAAGEPDDVHGATEPDDVHGAAALGFMGRRPRRRVAAGEPDAGATRRQRPSRARRVAVRDIGASCHDGRHPATAMCIRRPILGDDGPLPPVRARAPAVADAPLAFHSRGAVSGRR